MVSQILLLTQLIYEIKNKRILLQMDFFLQYLNNIYIKCNFENLEFLQ
jgi:hypothetical protein